MKLNRLLDRQITKWLPKDFVESETYSQFIKAVNNSYNAYERDIELLNHAFRINEEEYSDINQQLKEEISIKQLSISKLRHSIHSISVKDQSLGKDNDAEELLDIVNYLDEQIDKRKQAEQIYTSLIKNLQSGILLEDETRHIIFANQLFCDMFGIPVTAEMLAGVDCSNSAEQSKHLFADEQHFISNIRRILQNKTIVIGDILELKDGRVFQREYIPLYINNSYKGHLWKYDDITEKIASENKLKASESRFRVTLERLGDNVWEHDFRTGKTYFSNRNYDLLGNTEGDENNYADLWWRSIYPDDLKMVTDNDENYKNGITDHHSMEYRILHKNGTVKWILDKGVVIEKSLSGAPLKIIGTHTDISSLKEIETALKESELQFRSLSENIPGVLFTFEFEKNGKYGFRYLSPAIEKIFGISVEAFAAPQHFIHPEDMESLSEKITQARDNNRSFSFEGRLSVPGRGLCWFNVASSFSFERKDGARIYTGIITDITQRKMMEETLRIREEKYRNITANMRLGLLEVDNDEAITFANQSFCDMSGYSLEELLGKTASKIFLEGENAKLVDHKNELRKQGHSDAYEIGLQNKTGEQKWWLISGAPHYNDKGELIGSIGIHLDITNQKKLEHELTEAKRQAENSAQAKELFLANMSHEIRTPMNAIIGMSQQLYKTSLTSKQNLFLDAINNSAEHLLVIINDILDISKIEAGKLQLEKIGFNINTTIKNAVQVMQHKAEEKGLVFTSISDDNIANVLLGDPHRIKQVLLNLISNSIKFTDKGSVQVACSLYSNTPTSQQLQLTITDTGIGMDEAFQQKLFTNFSQEDNSVARKYGGTGLGMSISKKLVALMNGSITVSSAKNQGTAITVTLPFAKGDASMLQEKEAITIDASLLKGCRILLVEDNEMNRLVANTVLEHYGVSITEAVNGLEAVETMRKETFDLVLMDMQMPVMNGIAATIAIREEISTSIPIIALTANAIKGESDKCFEAGMNDYISKPFSEENLIKTICGLLGKDIHLVSKSTAPAIEMAPLFDLEGLRELSRGNESFVNKMVDIFIKAAPASLTEMKEAFAGGDYEKVKSIAHRLKPSIDNLAIVSMKTKIRDIESFPHQEAPHSRLETMIAESDLIISNVVAKLGEGIKKAG